MQVFRAYVEIAKPRSIALLLFTGIGGAIFAVGEEVFHNPTPLLVAVIFSGTCATAGANMLTSYLDREVDSKMLRTKKRPLPAGRIAPPEKALYSGLFLVSLSLAASSTVNLLCTFLIFLAVLDNVLVYSRFLKRKNPLNILFGSFSGGAPVLVGYAAVTGTLTLSAFLLAAVVVLWIPTHIWSLAIRFKEDYRRAKVPMLPTLVEEKKAVRCIAFTSTLLVAFSFLLYMTDGLGWGYLFSALGLGAAILTLNVFLALQPTGKNAWIVYKYSSPYLGLLFLAIILDVLL
jgi:protoheme IX farnesyltransferase